MTKLEKELFKMLKEEVYKAQYRYHKTQREDDCLRMMDLHEILRKAEDIRVECEEAE